MTSTIPVRCSTSYEVSLEAGQVLFGLVLKRVHFFAIFGFKIGQRKSSGKVNDNKCIDQCLFLYV